MLLKEYDIEHEFTEGENIIEFTPIKSGTVQYTCWMGMIRGNIFVTDENGEDIQEVSIDLTVPRTVLKFLPAIIDFTHI